MPVTRCFTLSCDRCEAKYNSHPWKGVLTADAESDGWQVKKEYLCPTCQKDNAVVNTEEIVSAQEIAVTTINKIEVQEYEVDSVKVLNIDGNECVIHQNPEWLIKNLKKHERKNDNWIKGFNDKAAMENINSNLD